MLINILGLIVFSVLLIRATYWLTDSLEHLSRLTGLGRFALTSIILATATSLPELVVGVTAALEGRPAIALGTVVGSNIADISLVIGGAAILGGSFSVAGSWLKLDIFSVFLAGGLPLVLLLDRSLSRADGLILLAVFLAYNYGILVNRGQSPVGRLLRPMAGRRRRQINSRLTGLFLGVALLIFSAEMIVKSSVVLARGLGVPVFLVALFLVAVGSSLPELSFEVTAVRKRQVGMALGDLLGSVVTNSTMILGVVSLINPIRLERGLAEYLLAAAAFGVIFLLFWYFVKSKMRLERWEGMALLLAYLVFALLEWNK